MKKINLTESELTSLVRRIINEGLASFRPLKELPNGTYKLTKVAEGTEVRGPFLKQENGITKIYGDNYTLKTDGDLSGGGTVYSTEK